MQTKEAQQIRRGILAARIDSTDEMENWNGLTDRAFWHETALQWERAATGKDVK